MSNKILLQFVLTLSIFSSSYSQTVYGLGDSYMFSKEHTSRISKEHSLDGVELYPIIEKDYEIKFTTYKTKNIEKHSLSKELLEFAIEDSINSYKRYGEEIINKNNLTKAKKLVNDYIKNVINRHQPMTFGDLKEAQSLLNTSSKYTHNVYSETSTTSNSTDKIKYKMLVHDRVGMKLHLIKEVSRIIINDISPISDVKFNIGLLTKELEENKPTKVYKKNIIYKVGNFPNGDVDIKSFDKTLKVINYAYKIIRKFNKKFIVGQVITSEQAKINGLIGGKYIGEKIVVTKCLEDGLYYACSISLLKRYAFSVDGKFNKN